MGDEKKSVLTPTIAPNSVQAWLLAARPKTLTGAAVPVLIGGAAAASDRLSSFLWPPFLLCLAFAMLMQVAANFVNDYYDFKKGTDTAERLGPARACAQGWVTPRAMLAAIAIVFVLACGAGLPLILYGGWGMIAVGAGCMLFCVLYTTFFSYAGMGDLLVLLFFGLIPTGFTYYIQMHTITLPVVSLALASGLAIDCLLIVNNFRDRDTDAATGKHTLVVQWGARFALAHYLLCGVAAWLLCLPMLFSGHPWAFVLPVFYLLLHLHTWRRMKKIDHGRALNAMLGETSRNMLLFGLLLSAGLLL